jgi:uncharacterized membrane protein YcaP (DUF421 family)
MHVDWERLFSVETSLLELFVRGTVMYFVLLLALRLLVRRHVGSMSLMDLLLMVLIADAAQNAMAGEYKSITEGIVLCGTLIGWNYFFDWLAYRFPMFQKLLEPEPLAVIKDGKFLRRNMRQEFITEDELVSQLRQHEVTDVGEVKLAFIEPDGAVTVVRNKKSTKERASLPKKRGASL